MMGLAREGWWGVGGLICLGWVGWWWVDWNGVWGLVGLAVIAWAGFCRHPRRHPPDDPTLWVAPADGRVVVVERDASGKVRVGIFMRIWDVHVNRAPFGGRIVDQVFQRGRFRPAFRSDVARVNTQLQTFVETEGQVWWWTQIAGIWARRVRSWVRPGQTVHRGAPVGMILLGSRVDVEFPPGTEVIVQPGQRVRAGETPLARRIS